MTLIYNHQPENFKHLSNFKSQKELNKNMEMWLADYKKEFTRKELFAFKAMLRYSVRCIGVATLKINTVIKAVLNFFGVEISDRTIKRMIKKVEAIGILKKHETIHPKTGLKGPNVYECMPYQCKTDFVTTENTEKELENAPQVDCKKVDLSLHKAIKTETNNNKILNTYSHTPTTAAHTQNSKNEKPKHQKPKERPIELKYHSKLKALLHEYNELENQKEIFEVIYGNINGLCKLPLYKQYRERIESIALEDLHYVLHYKHKFDSVKGILNKILSDDLKQFSLDLIHEAQKELAPAPTNMGLYSAANFDNDVTLNTPKSHVEPVVATVDVTDEDKVKKAQAQKRKALKKIGYTDEEIQAMQGA